eukprot:CAMPEP_0172377294 /NCGR_PEP_ID=MMETSP1060-20121228/68830_1 /TAXON_ID=37318 /ORGANISM="Pseudo-nitzschia pungens, Strain cf. cingulata" /LENGTH=395 /DNA_ID=CAMNT_0013104975 /DNA_START=66 /DNA_END=1253 /DNA_ORIENTATION=-
MAGFYRDPPIPYTRAFDSSKPKLVTLTVYNAQDQEDSVKVPRFTDKGKLEELLHTKEAFQNAAEDLELSANKYIKYFGRCLCVNAQTEWKSLTRQGYPHSLNGYKRVKYFGRCLCVNAQTEWKSLTRQGYPHSLNGYKRAFSAFIKRYCNPDDAKDIMHTYLRSPSCKKPSDTSCRDHVDRMETLMKYTTKLQGYAADLDHLQQMTIVLHSFQSSWIEDYCRIHKGIRQHTTAQFIIDHMSSLDRLSNATSSIDNPYDSDINSVSNQSIIANNSNSDNDSSHSDSANSNADSEEESDSDTESNQANNCNKRSYNNPCRIPGHDHDWSECPKNRYSKRNKSNSSNNSTASAPSNATDSTATNETFQAHMRQAMESYCMEYGGRVEKHFDGSLTWQP